MQTFCTIITADYYPYAAALYKSLRHYNSGISLHVLIADNKDIQAPGLPGLHLIKTADLANYKKIDDLFDRYAHINFDFFRWACKPLLLLYLLEKDYEKVIFVDCDIFFFNNYDFLFTELDTAGIMLTPHWWVSDPLVDEKSFSSMFTHGIFNAGFIGASKKGLEPLNWWANACHFKMGEHTALGIHDDQKYLDALPVLFENVKIIRHRGCNVAGWNKDECKRILVDKTVLINGIYPIVFIHFNNVFVREILRGHDPLLSHHLASYKQTFEEDDTQLSQFMPVLSSHLHPGLLKKIKWKLKLRTRLKSLFYRLARSL